MSLYHCRIHGQVWEYLGPEGSCVYCVNADRHPTDAEMKTGRQPDGSYVPCPECKWEPPVERRERPGRPVILPGTTHYGDCPTIPQISDECRERLIEMDRVRRRGAAEAWNYIIG